MCVQGTGCGTRSSSPFMFANNGKVVRVVQAERRVEAGLDGRNLVPAGGARVKAIPHFIAIGTRGTAHRLHHP